MTIELIIPSFLAGVLTFIAPCTLPLVPAYISFISGQSTNKRKILMNGLLFIVGFSLVFILFGILFGLLGSVIVPYRIWLTRIGGIFVILFGLFMLKIINISFLNQTEKIQLSPIFKRGEPLSSFLLGSSFAFGWTPCVGPILGSILILASTTSNVWQGGLLLTVFSLGLGTPFLLIAVGIGSASEKIKSFSKYLGIVEKVGGVFLIFLGILLFLDKLNLLVSWGFELFNRVNYDSIIKYL
ncbi:hypothetical protein A3F29_01365 [Candidatus Roizmanbacteria bacterium RIFCSPHIGHO2_12_FULL_33_9]|uniref:Cytochrome C biogenesis protein transmembrane domain-containing protein n=1 Tax=Candidatus Roizmanbacteria bacterium RIFCSPHIGHO2_12_FULL_33_9 TaxID=1802045 RepID=A0A1F7HKJ3_9BACT|nr:MAG: hypothetical protein A3F29_01365 [Candidatus Roizmanbacteria bacterium RIFCSPHIGHO2_12_FULL_33_9]